MNLIMLKLGGVVFLYFSTPVLLSHLYGMSMPLLSFPEECCAGRQEALVGGLLLSQAGEEGVVVLLYVDLQQVGGGQGFAAHRAGVPGEVHVSSSYAVVCCNGDCNGDRLDL